MADDDPIPESEIEKGNEGNDVPDDSAKLREVHERALDRFDAVAVPQIEMRAESLEDRRFTAITGAQWEGPYGDQAENSPRPEIDKVSKGKEKILSDWNNNRVVVDYVPANDSADEGTADTLDGLYRADSYHFKAMQARDNAIAEAVGGGFGAWRLTTEYADPEDPDNDEQRVNPGVPIVDADQSVYFYGGVRYDKSDAEAAFILSRDLRAIAEQKWGAANLVPWPANQWRWNWDWYTPDVACIAEYYEVEKCKDRLLVFTNKLTDEEQRFYSSDIEPSAARDLIAQGWAKRERNVKRDRIHKYIMNGSCVLKDCGYIAGNNIPIVPVYGHREFIDNQERWWGYTRKRKDRQRILNTAVGNVVETASLSPRDTPIVAPEQRTPEIDDQWSRANIDRLPYLQLMPLVDPVSGQIISAGPVGKVDAPQVQPATATLLQLMLAEASEEDQNADQVKANTSVEAMDLAAGRVDAKSGPFLDNMCQSVQREGEIYQPMARDTYFEEGRKVETRTEEGQDGTATLLEPHTDENGVYRIRNDLSKGKYKVVATIQEATDTRRQRTVRDALNLAEIMGKAGDAEVAQAAALTAMMNMDGHGMQDLQKFARQKALAIGLAKPTAEEKQQIEQAQQEQGQGQPSAADQALLAQTSELMSKAKLNEAGAAEKAASAHLKLAQADAVGGPDQAPDVPTGLHPAANDTVDALSKLAGAKLKVAQAAHLEHDMHHQTIKTGAELAQAEHQREMDRRAQDHAERTAA